MKRTISVFLTATFAATLPTCCTGESPATQPPPPAESLDLSAWKLTLPYNTKRRSGNPDEVVRPELDHFVDQAAFRVSDDQDSVLFRAPCDGRGTQNSKYPRSELREMTADGKDEASWGTDDQGAHALEAELAILQTPRTKAHVVCTQIHAADDDVLMVRLEGDELFIERDGQPDVMLDSEYELGARFSLRIVAQGGRIRAWHDGDLVMDWAKPAQGCYFKIGCYTQSNQDIEERPGAYGEVAVYRMKVTHSE